MDLPFAGNRLKAGRKQGREFGFAVAHHVALAATRRAVGGKGGNDEVAAGAHATHGLGHIGGALGGVGEEVQHRAVVPDVEAGFGQRQLRHVAGPP